jgi:hypothetical protein
MPKPLTPPDANLSQVNWVSFKGVYRTDSPGAAESIPAPGNQSSVADEGFSILLSALRRAQTGLASQSRPGSHPSPAEKAKTEEKL